MQTNKKILSYTKYTCASMYNLFIPSKKYPISNKFYIEIFKNLRVLQILPLFEQPSFTFAVNLHTVRENVLHQGLTV
jgi:hypothetical protein